MEQEGEGLVGGGGQGNGERGMPGTRERAGQSAPSASAVSLPSGWCAPRPVPRHRPSFPLALSPSRPLPLLCSFRFFSSHTLFHHCAVSTPASLSQPPVTLLSTRAVVVAARPYRPLPAWLPACILNTHLPRDPTNQPSSEPPHCSKFRN